MKRLLLLLVAISVPVLFFVSVYQVYRYNQLHREVREIQLEQKELYEKNKRMIANIAILSSPERIEKLAKEELGLERVPEHRMLQIRLPKRENQRQEQWQDH